MIKSQLTLKQLEAFVSVVDTGSFRRAARVLNTTQPNVSNRISTLEGLLDQVLMHRDSGSIRLTEKGIELLAQARQVLRASETFLETAARKDLIEDRLKLGVTELIACTWLHDFLRAFRAEYPSISVELQVDLSTEIERLLVAEELDLALHTGQSTSGSEADLSIGGYHYQWVVNQSIVKELGTRPTLDLVFTYPILTHARHTSAGHELHAFCRENSLPESQIIHSSSLNSCVPMAIDGMGIALLPNQLIREQISRGELVPIDCGWTPSPLDFFARYDESKVPNYVVSAAKLATAIAENTRQ